MSRKKARELRDTLLVGGFIIMLLGFIYDPLLIIGVIVTVSCLIPDFLFNKCPHCGKHLGRNEAKFCQFCGKPID